MDIEFVEAKQDEKNIVENLVQFYAYDFSKILKYDLDEYGKFDFMDTEEYLSKKENKAMFIKIDEKYAGFAFVRDDIRGFKDLDEFWIMPKYRQGLLTYQVLKKFFSLMDGRVEFCIMNQNERFKEVVEYMIKRRNFKIFKLIAKREVQYELKWGTYDFTEYIVECNNIKKHCE